jgi:hypothetical protein
MGEDVRVSKDTPGSYCYHAAPSEKEVSSSTNRLNGDCLLNDAQMLRERQISKRKKRSAWMRRPEWEEEVIIEMVK